MKYKNFAIHCEANMYNELLRKFNYYCDNHDVLQYIFVLYIFFILVARKLYNIFT